MEDSKQPTPATSAAEPGRAAGNAPDTAQEENARAPAPRTIGAFLLFVLKKIIARRKLMLLPLWVLLAVVGVLLLLSGGSSLLPVIYIAF